MTVEASDPAELDDPQADSLVGVVERISRFATMLYLATFKVLEIR